MTRSSFNFRALVANRAISESQISGMVSPFFSVKKFAEDGTNCQADTTLYPYCSYRTTPAAAKLQLEFRPYPYMDMDGETSLPINWDLNQGYANALGRAIFGRDKYHKWGFKCLLGRYVSIKQLFSIPENEQNSTHVLLVSDAPLKYFAGINNYDLYEFEGGKSAVMIPIGKAEHLV